MHSPSQCLIASHRCPSCAQHTCRQHSHAPMRWRCSLQLLLPVATNSVTWCRSDLIHPFSSTLTKPFQLAFNTVQQLPQGRSCSNGSHRSSIIQCTATTCPPCRLRNSQECRIAGKAGPGPQGDTPKALDMTLVCSAQHRAHVAIVNHL